MTSKPKTRSSGRSRRPSAKKRRKVSRKVISQIMSDRLEVWSESTQDLQDVVAYYRRELDGYPDKVFYLSCQDALILLAGTVPLNFKVGGFEMVLRHTESLGWFLEPGLGS